MLTVLGDLCASSRSTLSGSVQPGEKPQEHDRKFNHPNTLEGMRTIALANYSPTPITLSMASKADGHQPVPLPIFPDSGYMPIRASQMPAIAYRPLRRPWLVMLVLD